MEIFRFEWKQYRRSVWVWSIGIAVVIIVLLPLFMNLTDGTTDVSALLEGNALAEGMGINIDLFFTPLGIFAYLSSFIALAGAIQAMNLGLSIITKEHIQNTADFLMTKPHTRKYVLLSKFLSACYCLTITWACFFAASLGTLFLSAGTDFSFGTFSKLFLLFPMIQLLFLLLGIFVSIVVSRINSTLPLAMGVSFGLFVIGMFSSVVQSDVARIFSPFKYFNTNVILESGGFETGYLALYFLLLALFAILGYTVFVRKDMKMVL